MNAHLAKEDCVSLLMIRPGDADVSGNVPQALDRLVSDTERLISMLSGPENLVDEHTLHFALSVLRLGNQVISAVLLPPPPPDRSNEPPASAEDTQQQGERWQPPALSDLPPNELNRGAVREALVRELLARLAARNPP